MLHLSPTTLLRADTLCLTCGDDVELIRKFITDGGDVVVPWRHVDGPPRSHQAIPCREHLVWSTQPELARV